MQLLYFGSIYSSILWLKLPDALVRGTECIPLSHNIHPTNFCARYEIVLRLLRVRKPLDQAPRNLSEHFVNISGVN